MSQKGMVRLGIAGMVLAAILMAVAVGLALGQDAEAPAVVTVEKPNHVPEVLAVLADLKVDEPRTHKNMIVFPVRWSGKQAVGQWGTLDEAVAAGELKVLEKDSATVPEVHMENTGDRSLLLMSGEIIKGGRQTRVIRKDTVIEPKQKVAVAVFCVEQHRWAGDKEFKGGRYMAPAAIQDRMKRGADQGEVWREVRGRLNSLGAESQTGSLEEGLAQPAARKAAEDAKADLGHFSPPDTVGIAVADMRTGRVVGLELFGCRYLFAQLQTKLIEGYTIDVVTIQKAAWNDEDARKVTAKDVEAFIGRVLAGRSRYEDTPGSGRGVDLTSGTIKGKGVALGGHAMHLSIQDLVPQVTPARPIVTDPPGGREPPIRVIPLPEPMPRD